MNVPPPNSEIFGFPVKPALELGEAVAQMRIASGGRIGSSSGIFNEVIQLIPVAQQERTAGMAQLPPSLRNQASELLSRAESYVGVLAEFKNPRRTFVTEIGKVHEAVLAAAGNWRTELTEFGASDIAAGIHEVLGGLIEAPEHERGNLPMLAGLISARKHAANPLKLPPPFVLSVVAPEMLVMLDAPLPKSRRNPDAVEAVRRQPSPLRAVAALIKGRELRAVGAAAPVLLPRIRDLLPAKSSEVTERFEQVKEFLQQ